MDKTEAKILAMERRLYKLKTNGKNEDSPGVVKKLERKIRNARERQILSFFNKIGVKNGK